MIPWIIASAVIMLVFPWLAVTFVKGDGGMAVCFILFFALNPIYAIFAGAQAGKDVKRFWALPMITAILFLAGTWLHFDMGEPAFFSLCADLLAFRGRGHAALRVYKENT